MDVHDSAVSKPRVGRRGDKGDRKPPVRGINETAWKLLWNRALQDYSAESVSS